MKRVCIVGASGKLGRYMVQHSLAKGYEVNAVCREESAHKLEDFGDRIAVFAGRTNNRQVIQSAVAGCDGVLTVLVPWGVDHYSSGTAQAVLDFAEKEARLVFSCGWHVARDGQDEYSRFFLFTVRLVSLIARFLGAVDVDDQVEACRRIFASETSWTVVRGSDLEEGESEGLPVWSAHVGDPMLKSNKTRRTDFALFMVDALTNPEMVRQAPAIVSGASASARAHGAPATAPG